MSNYKRLLSFLLVSILALIMTACNNTGIGGTTTALSGTAATGAPIKGNVFAKDANGVEVEIASGVNGSFTLNTTGMTPPFMLRIVPADGSPTLYSYAQANGQTVNITSLTNLALFLAGNKVDLASVYSSWDGTAITAAAVSQAADIVIANFKAKIIAAGVTATNYNILTAQFNADGTGIDGVMDNLVVTVDPANGSFTVKDANNAAVVFNENIDTVLPVVVAPNNIQVTATTANGIAISDAAIVAFLSGATATDNIGVVGKVTHNNTLSILPVGTTTIIFSAKDAAGNTGTASATVTVSPLIISPTQFSLSAAVSGLSTGQGVTLLNGSDALAFNANATKVFATKINSGSTYSVSVRSQSGVTCTIQSSTGTITVDTTVQVACQTENQDTIAPIVTAPNNITVSATNTSGIAATNAAVVAFLVGATATDNVAVTGNITNDNSLTTFPVGTTTVTFSASDAAGNTGTATATITVTAQAVQYAIKGIVSGVAGTMTWELRTNNNAFVNDGPAQANGNVTFGMINDGATYVVTVSTGCTVTNGTGTVSGADVTNVSIVCGQGSDTVAPVVTAPSNITVMATSTAGIAATDATIVAFLSGATATDNVAVTGNITNDNSLITFPVGTTTVTFSASDAAGNTGTATATVTVNASGGTTNGASAFCPTVPNTTPPSFNGWKWAHAQPVAAKLLSVTEGNGIYVATGVAGTIIRSTDRINWTEVNSGYKKTIVDVMWDGTAFVALSEDRKTVLISCDGQSWSVNAVTVDGLASRLDLKHILRANNKYYSAKGQAVLESTDSVAWIGTTIAEITALGNFAFATDMATDGNNTLLITVASSAGMVTSTDGGTTWQSIANAPIPVGTGNNAGGGAHIVWNGSKFVVLVSSTELSSSMNGINWVSTTTTPPIAFQAFNRILHYYNNVPILCGGSNLFTSTNHNNSGSCYILDASSNWVSGDGKDNNLTSANNSTLTAPLQGRSLNKINDVLVTSASTLLIVGDAGIIAEQTNATIPLLNAANKNSWLRRSKGGGGGMLYGIASNGTNYVAVGTGTDILHSVDGANWVRATLPTYTAKVGFLTKTFNLGGFITQVQWTGTEYVALGKHRITSPDGIAWTTEVTNTVTSSQEPYRSHVFNSKLIWPSAGNVNIRTDKDNIATADATAGATVVGGGNAKIFGFADNGIQFITVGNFGITSSSDLQTWVSADLSGISNSASFTFLGLAYNGTKFMALGVDTSNSDAAIALESTDGLAWSAIDLSGATIDGSTIGTQISQLFTANTSQGDFSSGNGKFIMSPASGQPLVTVDGITWTSLMGIEHSVFTTGSVSPIKYTFKYYQSGSKEFLLGERNAILVK